MGYYRDTYYPSQLIDIFCVNAAGLYAIAYYRMWAP